MEDDAGLGGLDDTPALFVDTVPQNIWLNPSLAALAVMIDEDEKEKTVENGEGQEEEVEGERVQKSNRKECRTHEVSAEKEPSGTKVASMSAENLEGGAILSETHKLASPRQEAMRQRRKKRRTSPYRVHNPSRFESGRSSGRRATTGETQVLMSLWNI
ncbi:unnamed protein product [Discosporangium mesarthrocarpum]